VTAKAESSASPFREATCSAPIERTRRMRDIVLRHLPSPAPAMRVLDLGCGTGLLVGELAAALPDAAITGVDVSAANIRAAAARLAASGMPARVGFVEADYLAYAAPPFDAIVCDGVLHLIPGSTETLFAKLERDLRPGGLLVCAMPYDCLYNRLFAVVRRALRALRSRATDAAILAAARLIHGREMDPAGLRERVRYMYMPPERLESRWLTATLAPSVGLYLVAQYPLRSVSPSQLRHRASIFEKRDH
jgi:2-polyprenyl-3-methyl-5-hydroxy-6-metoxy-1,4-benzoquinol methylase